MAALDAIQQLSDLKSRARSHEQLFAGIQRTRNTSAFPGKTQLDIPYLRSVASELVRPSYGHLGVRGRGDNRKVLSHLSQQVWAAAVTYMLKIFAKADLTYCVECGLSAQVPPAALSDLESFNSTPRLARTLVVARQCIRVLCPRPITTILPWIPHTTQHVQCLMRAGTRAAGLCPSSLMVLTLIMCAAINALLSVATSPVRRR